MPLYSPPFGGCDYSRYRPNLPRPVGDQPPVHGADPRKRCHNYNEQGHVHQHCPWRADPGHPLPPATAPPRPGGPVPGSRLPSHSALDRQQPWQYSYGQANIAASAAAAALPMVMLCLRTDSTPLTPRPTAPATATTVISRIKPTHTTRSHITRRRTWTTHSALAPPLPLRLPPEHLHLCRTLCTYSWHNRCLKASRIRIQCLAVSVLLGWP